MEEPETNDSLEIQVSQEEHHHHAEAALDLDLDCQYRTDVKHVYSFTVMSSTGDVILWGESPQGFFKGLRSNPCHFHVYAHTVDGLVKRKTLGALCKHQVVHMLPVPITQQGELLAVSCAECHVIRLLDLKDGNTTTAFNDNDDKMPGRMCHGEPEVMYMVYGSPQGDYKVLEMGCATTKFTSLRTYSTGIAVHQAPPDVCYAPQPHRMLVVSSNRPSKIVRAYPLDTQQEKGDLSPKRTNAPVKVGETEATIVRNHGFQTDTAPNNENNENAAESRLQRHSQHVEKTQRMKIEWLSDTNLAGEDPSVEQTLNETHKEVVTTSKTEKTTIVSSSTRTETSSRTTTQTTVEVNGEASSSIAPSEGSQYDNIPTKQSDNQDKPKAQEEHNHTPPAKEGEDLDLSQTTGEGGEASHSHGQGTGHDTRWQHWFTFRNEVHDDDCTPSAVYYSRTHDVILVGDMLNNQLIVLGPVDGQHLYSLRLTNPGWVEHICAYDSSKILPTGVVRSPSFMNKVLCGAGSSSDAKNKDKSNAPKKPSASDPAGSEDTPAGGQDKTTSGHVTNGLDDVTSEEIAIWTDNPYSSETKQAVSFYVLNTKHE